jgi:hypothetical protein
MQIERNFQNKLFVMAAKDFNLVPIRPSILISLAGWQRQLLHSHWI